jgi:hypothetical protein
MSTQPPDRDESPSSPTAESGDTWTTVPKATLASDPADDGSGPYTVHGVALGPPDTLTRGENSLKRWPEAGLRDAAASLAGKDIWYYPPDPDHHNKDRNRRRIGRVSRSAYQDSYGILYEAELTDQAVANRLSLGDLDVSIEATATPEANLATDETGATVMDSFEFTGMAIVSNGAAPGTHTSHGNASSNPAVAALSGSDVDTMLDDIPDVEMADRDGAAALAHSDFSVGDTVTWNTSGSPATGKIRELYEEGEAIPTSAYKGDGSQNGPGAVIAVYRKGEDGWEPKPGDFDSPDGDSEERVAHDTSGDTLSKSQAKLSEAALANEVTSVSYEGTKGGKLDEQKLPEEGFKSHYLVPGDTKSSSSFPVVDDSNFLRAGNVSAAWNLSGQSSDASKTALRERLVRLNREWDEGNRPISEESIENANLSVDPTANAMRSALAALSDDDRASLAVPGGIDTTPPQTAQDNAQQALNARDDTDNPNDCGTEVGWRRANQLANGEELSEDTLSRMSQFARHESNSDQGEDGREDCGWMMWNAWGGDEGVDWAQRKLDEIDRARAETAAAALVTPNAATSDIDEKGDSTTNTNNTDTDADTDSGTDSGTDGDTTQTVTEPSDELAASSTGPDSSAPITNGDSNRASDAHADGEADPTQTESSHTSNMAPDDSETDVTDQPDEQPDEQANSNDTGTDTDAGTESAPSIDLDGKAVIDDDQLDQLKSAAEERDALREEKQSLTTAIEQKDETIASQNEILSHLGETAAAELAAETGHSEDFYGDLSPEKTLAELGRIRDQETIDSDGGTTSATDADNESTDGEPSEAATGAAALARSKGQDPPNTQGGSISADATLSEDEAAAQDEKVHAALSGGDVLELNRSGASPREFVRSEYGVDPTEHDEYSLRDAIADSDTNGANGGGV